MYRVLRGEMVKIGLSISDLAAQVGVTEKTLRNKMNGITDFTFPEAKKIRGIVNPQMSLEDLFLKEDTDKKRA